MCFLSDFSKEITSVGNKIWHLGFRFLMLSDLLVICFSFSLYLQVRFRIQESKVDFMSSNRLGLTNCLVINFSKTHKIISHVRHCLGCILSSWKSLRSPNCLSYFSLKNAYLNFCFRLFRTMLALHALLRFFVLLLTCYCVKLFQYSFEVWFWRPTPFEV